MLLPGLTPPHYPQALPPIEPPESTPKTTTIAPLLPPLLPPTPFPVMIVPESLSNEAADAVTPVPSIRQSCLKLMKFIFNENHKLLIVQCVAGNRAHLAGNGHLDSVFEKLRTSVIENLDPSTW